MYKNNVKLLSKTASNVGFPSLKAKGYRVKERAEKATKREMKMQVIHQPRKPSPASTEVIALTNTNSSQRLTAAHPQAPPRLLRLLLLLLPSIPFPHPHCLDSPPSLLLALLEIRLRQ